MKLIFARRLSFLISLLALTGAGGELSAVAQTLGGEDTGSVDASLLSENTADADVALADVELAPESDDSPGTVISCLNQLAMLCSDQRLSPIAEDINGNDAQSLRGTMPLAATSLMPYSDPSSVDTASSQEPGEEPAIAQSDVERDRVRYGYNYLGVGINIGFSDSGSPLGRGSFAIISKLNLAPQLSLRPSMLFGDNLMFLVPVTIDFPLEKTEHKTRVNVLPYLGGGVGIAIGNDSGFGVFGTAGIDTVLTSDFTATVGLNVGYIEEFEAGLLIGGAYNF